MTYRPMDISHHKRHKLEEEELQRESIAYLFAFPEHGVAGYLYSWVNGFGRAGSAVYVYGPGVGDEPIELLVNGVQMDAEDDFDDWKVGDLHIRHGDDETMTATVRNPRIEVDYSFVPYHPAYLYSSHPDGAPSFIAKDRFEQSGLIKGELRFDGKVIPFDTTGHRDHSWGTRHWGIAQHWKWCETQAGPEFAVHFMELHAMGNRLVHGYVWRDNQMAEITDLDVRYEFDEDFWHTSAVAAVTDELGRTTTVKGEVFARYVMNPHPMSKNHEGSLKLEIEGVPGVGHLEMQWQKPYLDYIQNEPYMKQHATGVPLGADRIRAE
jgi:hypothetical protein